MGSKRSLTPELWRVLLVVGLLAACSGPSHAFAGTVYDPPQQAPDIPLRTTKGSPFELDSLRGKVVLLFFGYTSCPDVCPATLAEMKRLFEALEGDTDRVVFGLISVDPERDTPDAVRVYLDRFHPAFIGLVGSTEEIAQVSDQYGVYFEREKSDDPTDYLVTHTARVFLIDPDGMLRTNYSFGTTAEAFEDDIRYLLEDGR